MARLLSYRIGSLQQPHLPFSSLPDLGIGAVELVWTDQTTPQRVRDAVDPFGLRVGSLHVPCPLEDESLPQAMRRHAAHAAELGAGYLFVSAAAGQMPRQQAYDRLRRLGDAVGSHKVYLAMETHPDLCQNAEQMLQTMARVDHPWVGVNFDTANVCYYTQGADTIEELRKVTSHIRGVHLKDTTGGYLDGDFPVFGQGTVDFDAVDQALTGAGYGGPYTMELEGGAFDCADPKELAGKVSRCVAHLQRVGLVG